MLLLKNVCILTFFLWGNSVLFTIHIHSQCPVGWNSVNSCEEQYSWLQETHLLKIFNYPSVGPLVLLAAQPALMSWKSKSLFVCCVYSLCATISRRRQTLPSTLLSRCWSLDLMTETPIWTELSCWWHSQSKNFLVCLVWWFCKLLY